MSSTNYFNTLIEIAEDCAVESGVVPPTRGKKKSVANLQYEMLSEQPYKFTSDDVLFGVYALRKEVPEEAMEEERERYFSKGQPCFRASPLTKTYGWGVHSDEEGRIALYGVETDEYRRLQADESVVKVRAMRSKRVSK